MLPNCILPDEIQTCKTNPLGHRVGASKLTCLKANSYHTPTCFRVSFPIPVNENLILPVVQDKILNVSLVSSNKSHQQVLLAFLEKIHENSFWSLCHHFLPPLSLTSLYKPHYLSFGLSHKTPTWLFCKALLPYNQSSSSHQQIISKHGRSCHSFTKT